MVVLALHAQMVGQGNYSITCTKQTLGRTTIKVDRVEYWILHVKAMLACHGNVGVTGRESRLWGAGHGCAIMQCNLIAAIRVLDTLGFLESAHSVLGKCTQRSWKIYLRIPPPLILLYTDTLPLK